MRADQDGGLERFLRAQAPVYDRVRAELGAGRKVSHWMWFIFPQLRQLGHSPTAQYYGIASRQEAHGYWQHLVLGARLRECTQLVLAVEGTTAHALFGSPDDLKFRSSLTLFEQVAPEAPVFGQALEKYYSGERDLLTLALLADEPQPQEP
jgi:uncharacterized protein (DUF1810 family)